MVEMQGDEMTRCVDCDHSTVRPTYPHTFVLGGVEDKVRGLDMSYVSQSFFKCNMYVHTYVRTYFGMWWSLYRGAIALP